MSFLETCRQSRRTVVALVYMSYLLDNILMTVIVPIVPELLLKPKETTIVISSSRSPNLSTDSVKDIDKGSYHYFASTAKPILTAARSDEIGFLFASKSIVQLVVNPMVAYMSSRFAYTSLMFAGNCFFILSALIYAVAGSFGSLLVARSVHGLGSSLSLISGMALLSELFQDDAERSRNIGVAFSGMALGVLIGYPFGGVVSEFAGSALVFCLIAIVMIIVQALQYLIFKRDNVLTKSATTLASVTGIDWRLACDPFIMTCLGSIGLSTMAIATLEACLPIWLQQTIKSEEWQLGTVFIPDSLGYLIGTNLFGFVALKLGRWVCALSSMVTIGFCLIMIPFSTRIVHLIGPHFGIGLGVATIDASLVPLLARLVETRHQPNFGTVFALAQTTVCLAYAVGPLLGGILLPVIGFPWLLRAIALINIVYAPSNFFLKDAAVASENLGLLENEAWEDSYGSSERNKGLLDENDFCENDIYSD